MVLLSIALLHGTALAGDEKPKPEVTVGGLVFAHYGLDLTEGAENYNEFALDRAYLTAKAKITPNFGARLTLDADHIKPVDTGAGEVTIDTKYRFFVKHAYLEVKDFAPGMEIRAGVIDTPYTGYYDKFLEHRFVAKSMSDGNGNMATADLGVSIGGTHAKGLIDWNAGIYNGEGYSKLEIDAGKSLIARVSVDPMAAQKKASLPITGYVDYHMVQDGDPILVYAGAAGFKMPYVWFWGEYTGRSQGDLTGGGYSIALMPGMPKYFRVIARYDSYDPNTEAENDASSTLIGGVSHNFYDKISLAATYERTTAEAAPEEPEHGVFLRMQAGF
jgi:hypothetical protein